MTYNLTHNCRYLQDNSTLYLPEELTQITNEIDHHIRNTLYQDDLLTIFNVNSLEEINELTWLDQFYHTLPEEFKSHIKTHNYLGDEIASFILCHNYTLLWYLHDYLKDKTPQKLNTFIDKSIIAFQKNHPLTNSLNTL